MLTGVALVMTVVEDAPVLSRRCHRPKEKSIRCQANGKGKAERGRVREVAAYEIPHSYRLVFSQHANPIGWLAGLLIVSIFDFRVIRWENWFFSMTLRF